MSQRAGYIMARGFNTDVKGDPFDQSTINKVWEKGKIVDEN